MTTQTEALKRIAAYPFSRAEELSVEQMREIAREALAQPEQEKDSPTSCWMCGEDGGTSCGSQYCGLLCAEPDDDQPELSSVTYKDVTDTMNALYAGDIKQVQIAMALESKKLYTTPPQRTWVGLTDDEFQLIYDMGRTPAGMMEMVEAKLKEKNNA